VRQLLRFELKEQMKQLEKDLSGQKRYLGQHALQLHTLVSLEALREDMLNAIADRAFIAEDALPRSEQEFIAQRQRARARLPAVTDAVVRVVQNIANECPALMERLSAAGSGVSTAGMARLRNDLAQQMHNLVYPGFLSATPWEKLQHLPRYVKGMVLRLDKYAANPERDGRHAAAIAGLWNPYAQRLRKHRDNGISDPNLADFRWQVEELRISLFAQELRTPSPVSVKRLQKLWEEMRS
jgi:ATP-dependent helicase HrpA